jgi:hypothetical protein
VTSNFESARANARERGNGAAIASRAVRRRYGAWAPRHHQGSTEAWSAVVRRAEWREGEGGGGAPRSCAGMAGAAVRSAERNCKCNGKRCWLRSASASASDETSEVRKPAAGEARAPNRDMAVSLASARHPVLTPGAPFTRSFLAACSWNAALLLLGGEEKKSQQEMSVLLKLPPHMASPSHNVQWSTPSTCSNHDDAAGLDSTRLGEAPRSHGVWKSS